MGVADGYGVECLRVMQHRVSVCPVSACCLIRITAVDDRSSDWSHVVDLYNSATGAWSTAQLSVARNNLAATSVGNVALFAGGFEIASSLLCRKGSVGCLLCLS